MSRTKARATLTVASLPAQLGGRSSHDEKADALLDEHPMSYKDIDQSMADHADLVTIVHTLQQVLNYKGT